MKSQAAANNNIYLTLPYLIPISPTEPPENLNPNPNPNHMHIISIHSLAHALTCH